MSLSKNLRFTFIRQAAAAFHQGFEVAKRCLGEVSKV